MDKYLSTCHTAPFSPTEHKSIHATKFPCFQVRKDDVCGLHWKGTDPPHSPLRPVKPALTSGAERPNTHWLPEGEPLPERGTPRSRCRGSALQHHKMSSTRSTRSTRRSCPPALPVKKIPTRLPEWALCSPPALPHLPTAKGRGGTERGYNRRSRSRVWGLCYTDLSIMILGSPIQGIRCRPCSWYWAFSSSRNSLQA